MMRNARAALGVIRPGRNQLWSKPRLVRAGIAAAVAVLSGIGCGGPSGTFYVVQNQVPGAGCTIPGTEGALYLGQGTLDVRASVGSGYLLFPLLKNDLPAEGSGGTEPNRIALDGFDVDVKVIDGPAAALEVFGAVAGDPAADVATMRTVSFVMKDGLVYKQDGAAVTHEAKL